MQLSFFHKFLFLAWLGCLVHALFTNPGFLLGLVFIGIIMAVVR